MTDDCPGVGSIDASGLGKPFRVTTERAASGEEIASVSGRLVGVRHRLTGDGKVSTVAEVDIGPVVVELPLGEEEV